LTGETNILYRRISCKVRYFKSLFVVIDAIFNIIDDYGYENLFTIF